MTFVISFPRYTFTHLGCHLRQTGLENLYTPYLCIGRKQVTTLDHVYGRCILRWHNLTSSYTLSSAEATPVRLGNQIVPSILNRPCRPFLRLIKWCFKKNIKKIQIHEIKKKMRKQAFFARLCQKSYKFFLLFNFSRGLQQG